MFNCATIEQTVVAKFAQATDLPFIRKCFLNKPVCADKSAFQFFRVTSALF